jgi:hypothetical protein
VLEIGVSIRDEVLARGLMQWYNALPEKPQPHKLCSTTMPARASLDEPKQQTQDLKQKIHQQA